MPAVPPDPINITAKFKIENLGNSNVKDVIIKDCSVISSDNIELGKIDIYSDPAINILPSEIDSITFYKESSFKKLFNDPCGDSIYLIITLGDKNGNSKEVHTNKFFYGCAY
ncbi:MAG: hypothetical protein H6613_03415 [Ignavibacteriales bacterium]|nr:hypothetical protein [Ignavibacteriales bacterium]